MIAFDLNCKNGHTFEGWFKDSEAFEEQLEKGLIACPVCDSTSVHKALSTFAIVKGQKGASMEEGKTPILPDGARQKFLQDLNRQITHFVERNFDNVGTDFAKEALKIHCGVSEPRNIRGVSTAEEEKILKDEGVDFVKVPALPDPDKDHDA